MVLLLIIFVFFVISSVIKDTILSKYLLTGSTYALCLMQQYTWKEVCYELQWINLNATEMRHPKI